MPVTATKEGRWDMEEQIAISFSELDHVEITCKACGTGTVIPGGTD